MRGSYTGRQCINELYHDGLAGVFGTQSLLRDECQLLFWYEATKGYLMRYMPRHQSLPMYSAGLLTPQPCQQQKDSVPSTSAHITKARSAPASQSLYSTPQARYFPSRNPICHTYTVQTAGIRSRPDSSAPFPLPPHSPRTTCMYRPSIPSQRQSSPTRITMSKLRGG